MKNNVQFTLKVSCFILILVAMCQCASNPILQIEDPCVGVDVYSLGRQAGASGLPSPEHAAADELGQCVPKPGSKPMDVYKAGRNAGLVEYCSRENGLNVGKSDQSYFFVCPEFMEPEFLKGYNEGMQFRQLQEESRKIGKEIADLSDVLRSEPQGSVLKQLNEKKLNRLQLQKKQIDKKLQADASIED